MATNYEVSNLINRTMTAGDIRDLLAHMDDDTPVLFSCDYGDTCHTQQALPIRDMDEAYTSDLQDSMYSLSRVEYAQADGDVEYYCPKCEQETDHAVCPCCNGTCVTEDGEPATVPADMDTDKVAIFRMGS